MAFTDEDKYFITILCKEKRYSYCKLIREFQNKSWNHHGVRLHDQEVTNLIRLSEN